MKYKIVSQDPSSIIDLNFAKKYLKIDDPEESSTVNELLQAAIEYCEVETKRAVCKKQIELYLNAIPNEEVVLPKPPLLSILEVKIKDVLGDIVLGQNDYAVDSIDEPAKLKFLNTFANSSISYNSIVIKYEAGYDINSLPKTLQQAILLLMQHWYDNRDIVTTGSISKEVEFTVKSLLRANRILYW